MGTLHCSFGSTKAEAKHGDCEHDPPVYNHVMEPVHNDSKEAQKRKLDGEDDTPTQRDVRKPHPETPHDRWLRTHEDLFIGWVEMRR